MADGGKVFVAGPRGRPPTREEAEAMANALFDRLVGDRAEPDEGENDDRK